MIIKGKRGSFHSEIDGFVKDQEGTPVIIYGLLDGTDLPSLVASGAELHIEKVPLQGMMVGFMGILTENEKELDAIFKGHELHALSRGDKLNIVRSVFHNFLQAMLRGDN